MYGPDGKREDVAGTGTPWSCELVRGLFPPTNRDPDPNPTREADLTGEEEELNRLGMRRKFRVEVEVGECFGKYRDVS